MSADLPAGRVFDAMIVASATKGGAKTLLSEDLNHDQLIEGVHVLNPFMAQ